MYRTILIPVLLLLGYLWHVIAIKLSKGKTAGEGSYKDLIPYFLKFDLETGADLIGLIVIGGIWLDQGSILPFAIPQAWYLAPVVGFISPWTWRWVIKLYKNKVANGKIDD